MVIDMQTVGSFALCAIMILIFIVGFKETDKSGKSNKGNSTSSKTSAPQDTEQK